MLMYSIPPGYRRSKPAAKPKLGPWLRIIDQILEQDESQPKKQRHTAKRIWDRLKEEHGFQCGYTIVADYVRESRLRHKEVPTSDTRSHLLAGLCLYRDQRDAYEHQDMHEHDNVESAPAR